MIQEIVIPESAAEPKFFGGMTGGMSGGEGGGGGFINSGDATQGGNVSGGVAPVRFASLDLSFLGGNGGGLPLWGWLVIGGGVVFAAIKIFK